MIVSAYTFNAEANHSKLNSNAAISFPVPCDVCAAAIRYALFENIQNAPIPTMIK